MKVQGKVILVTGAGSGIGRELVLHLLAKGARVAGVDLNPDSIKETKKRAGLHEQCFWGHVADISDRAAVEAFPQQIIARFGDIDGVINNAGVIQPFVRLKDLDYPTINRILDVNLFGTLFVTKAFLPYLLERPEAHIVNVSSMGGLVPVPGQTVYGAAKAAVKLMTEGLAAELLDTQVKVSVVIPGAVATNIMENSGVKMVAHSSGGGRGIKAIQAADAAQLIIRGMERDDYQILVGKDAKMADKFYRLNPAFAARTIARKMRVLLPE
jgi:NAD(P)-dependent dehydrogenase (short-subunit alcohol dehydrogenase family)